MSDEYIDPDAHLPYPESPEYPSASVRDLHAAPDDRVLDPVRQGTGRFSPWVGDPTPPVQMPEVASDEGEIADERNLIAEVGGNSQSARTRFWLMAVVVAAIAAIAIVGFLTLPR